MISIFQEVLGFVATFFYVVWFLMLSSIIWSSLLGKSTKDIWDVESIFYLENSLFTVFDYFFNLSLYFLILTLTSTILSHILVSTTELFFIFWIDLYCFIVYIFLFLGLLKLLFLVRCWIYNIYIYSVDLLLGSQVMSVEVFLLIYFQLLFVKFSRLCIVRKSLYSTVFSYV